MAVRKQIGNAVFDIPETGEPEWGEELTAYLDAVGDALQSVQGPNDILISTAPILNNQTTPINVTGLSFDSSEVLAVEVEYFIERVTTGSTITESGSIVGNYDGSAWKINTSGVGAVGVDFTVNGSGQFQYTSTNLTNYVSGQIRFKAKTLDQA